MDERLAELERAISRMKYKWYALGWLSGTIGALIGQVIAEVTR